jgi:hypothetical protein
LLACAGLTFGSGVRAEINESELVRVVNESLLRKPAARLTFFSRVRLVDGSSATRVELPFDDLHADIRPRAVAAGWQSNDLVVIIVISEKMLMMCAANGSDGC